MKRIAWITDPHLNFLESDGVQEFCRSIVGQAPDAVLIGGDIGEADTTEGYLQYLEDELQRPVYFVLGNHDFYGGSIAGVRSEIKKLARNSIWLHWLPEADVVELTPKTCLTGHDGWADGRLGDYRRSDVLLNDYFLIRELMGQDSIARLAMLNRLGDEAAAYLKGVLPQALERFEHILVLTHVPPFKETCWHEGAISGDDWLPHFACKATGEVLLDSMASHPHRKMTVLCGHTHGAGTADILPNLFVKTGGARYCEPRIQELLAVE